jgi:hypothetical protein
MSTPIQAAETRQRPLRRLFGRIVCAHARMNAFNERTWHEEYQAGDDDAELRGARSWAVETWLIQSVLFLVPLLLLRRPLLDYEEQSLLSGWWTPSGLLGFGFALARYGWCCFPLFALVAYGLYRLRRCGGIRVWYSDLLAGLANMAVFWLVLILCVAGTAF